MSYIYKYSMPLLLFSTIFAHTLSSLSPLTLSCWNRECKCPYCVARWTHFQRPSSASAGHLFNLSVPLSYHSRPSSIISRSCDPSAMILPSSPPSRFASPLGVYTLQTNTIPQQPLQTTSNMQHKRNEIEKKRACQNCQLAATMGRSADVINVV